MEVLRVFVVEHILQHDARLDWIVWQIHQNHIRLESVCLACPPRRAAGPRRCISMPPAETLQATEHAQPDVA